MLKASQLHKRTSKAQHVHRSFSVQLKPVRSCSNSFPTEDMHEPCEETIYVFVQGEAFK